MSVKVDEAQANCAPSGLIAAGLMLLQLMSPLKSALMRGGGVSARAVHGNRIVAAGALHVAESLRTFVSVVQKPATVRSALNVASGRRANSSSALQPKDAYYTQCFCVSSWFRVPEQGMDTFELLSRASGFLVPRAGGEGGVHIVTSAHVVHPFAFPNYYPPAEHAWLGFVGERHVMTKFEIRERTEGRVIVSIDLHDKVFRHESRDICVVHPQDQKEFLRALEGLEGGSRLHLLELEEDAAAREKGEVMFVGHQIIQASGALQDQLPTVVPGAVLGCTPNGQAFASTESTLQMGMCGGPVMNARGRCIGATEGIVPDTGLCELPRLCPVSWTWSPRRTYFCMSLSKGKTRSTVLILFVQALSHVYSPCILLPRDPPMILLDQARNHCGYVQQ